MHAITLLFPFLAIECEEGEIRLVGSPESDKEGIVEICFGTLWGIISDNSWSDENAKVVCSQLNFTPSRECFCLLMYNCHYQQSSVNTCDMYLHKKNLLKVCQSKTDNFS